MKQTGTQYRQSKLSTPKSVALTNLLGSKAASELGTSKISKRSEEAQSQNMILKSKVKKLKDEKKSLLDLNKLLIQKLSLLNEKRK